MISTVVMKPLKDCNAVCSYCCDGQKGSRQWTYSEACDTIEALSSQVADDVLFVWQGGEPMLLPRKFYYEIYDFTKKLLPNCKFTLQTNLTLLTPEWIECIKDIFSGEVSVSYDFTAKNRRLLSGDDYQRRLSENLESLSKARCSFGAISTVEEADLPSFVAAFQRLQTYEEACHTWQINYCVPIGNAKSKKSIFAHGVFGDFLISAYHYWSSSKSCFRLEPLHRMMHTITSGDQTCGWSRSCVGSLLSISEDFQAYGCCGFESEKELSFGDARKTKSLVFSENARRLARRQVKFPKTCNSCEVFEWCNAGCARDAFASTRDIYGKFPYCEDWKKIFKFLSAEKSSHQFRELLARYDND